VPLWTTQPVTGVVISAALADVAKATIAIAALAGILILRFIFIRHPPASLRGLQKKVKSNSKVARHST
jgi:hypothetical protein